MQARGVLKRLPMFSELLEDSVRWADGTIVHADVILWCTGFRSSLDHLAPLMLRETSGGITMTGRSVCLGSQRYVYGSTASVPTMPASRWPGMRQ
jgi:hypothetical protein